MSDEDRHVQGFCPRGCGETLLLGDGGHVTCGYLECPDPSAADTILRDRETEHIVLFGEKGFSIQHPLRERVDGELFDCRLHACCRALGGPPRTPGRYRATLVDGDWKFQSVGEPGLS